MNIILHRVFGVLSVQDMGRPGLIAQGLSRGGAMDRSALINAAALLGADAPLASIEMAGAGGEFTVDEPTRIALTGAPMVVNLDGSPLRWNAAHLIGPGQHLSITGVQSGSYGYLTPAGGMATEEWISSRSAHLNIGLFEVLKPGSYPVNSDPAPETPARFMELENYFKGGILRVVDSAQTALFGDDVLEAFFATEFTRSTRGNRQGIRFDADRFFKSDRAAGIASDMIGPGELQMIGDGVPFVLMAECQTMGGYPRLGTVIPADLPIAAQAAPGEKLRFQRVTLEESDALWKTDHQRLKEAISRCRLLIRDPRTITDLLSYQLVGGVTAGHELGENDAGGS